MKYTLSTETREQDGHTLHRIEYSEEFKQHIKAEYGIALSDGWIESEDNLSQDGNARVYGDASVYGNACVSGNACVYGNASVSQGCTTSMHISTTAQWHEYQYRKAELQAKFDKENKEGEEK